MSAVLSASAARSAPGRPGGAAPGLRDRVGIEAAVRLLRSSDPSERLRGVERAAATHTPEALGLLVRVAASTGTGSLDPRFPTEGVARTDPRALLEAVRGLAAWSKRDNARSALAAIVSAPTVSFALRATGPSADPVDDEARGAARVALARREAALALAETKSNLAVEALIAVARAGGPGQAAAIEALGIDPPESPVALGGVALTTPAMIQLAAQVGDLRALDGILAAARSSDPALRAEAFQALALQGDARAIEPARASTLDPDVRVRLAAAEVLARLNAPDAPGLIASLVADDATALAALRLSDLVQDDGLVRAAAARAVASADPGLRAAAIQALGKQESPQAVAVLSPLVLDAMAGGQAAFAIARSPSGAAMSALESMSRALGTRRLAARAYLVRRIARSERSEPLDALARELRASQDGRDRAVGVLLGVVFGDVSMASALADPDARVRRAAASAALSRSKDPSAQEALLSRLSAEPDVTTRVVLMTALAWREPRQPVPLSRLLERIERAGPDAPIAALAIARRSHEVAPAALEALLAARDAVLRTHAMRGLGDSAAPDAVGRLVAAYAWEEDAAARRAIVSALAARDEDARQTARPTLELAASLDPDPVARWTAARALAGRGSGAKVERAGRDVLWVQLVPASGAAPLTGETGEMVLADGLAVPVVFDDDGYAVLPGVDPGEARLRLAPKVPAYSSPWP